MYRILISGYYGFNNIGDESILRAVIASLKLKLEDIDIMVLSKNPESTARRYHVKSANRKSVTAILKAVKECDLLISGGGSLLQDATSKRSILYYLMIMWLGILLRKKIFIYSQGIGPIVSKLNRKLTAWTLKRVDGIVVRDKASKELLIEIGLRSEDIYVTTDPVLRIPKADLKKGQQILEDEGIALDKNKITVGFAIRERKINSCFVNELCTSIQRLIAEKDAQIVLIPFHYSEDMAVIREIEKRISGELGCIKHKYLTEEMMSIIGNMDVLVGVRLHSIIHAAVMDVPIIAISYDPKINSFMHSIDMKAMSSIYDFKSDFFMEEFEKTIQNQEEIRIRVQRRMKELLVKLDTNEELILSLMGNGKERPPVA
ncbi:polysaccharide pyruvyl transferase CsaB [Sinanaerobacter sp. ZZT-01]|uniref:polysaccharide pyruvyl transferase CsaB n=1 Tax=Sinanaerobacter sp. ZZT-01 TaxID=3111540 RepID=UPI002D778ACF|nr:polysaccharide pyruvyl transferase CsaB [Sinanaerobacter sp. ZZT-01]WRR93501.1 polysaccharide pyruvyl transferase CsaB [Sinanaerobacter sp. ZZT-01]